MRVKSAAFNWSDEELLNELDAAKSGIVIRGKYEKKNKSALETIKKKMKFKSSKDKEHNSNERSDEEKGDAGRRKKHDDESELVHIDMNESVSLISGGKQFAEDSLTSQDMELSISMDAKKGCDEESEYQRLHGSHESAAGSVA